jgi:hypothetical protein
MKLALEFYFPGMTSHYSSLIQQVHFLEVIQSDKDVPIATLAYGYVTYPAAYVICRDLGVFNLTLLCAFSLLAL